MKAGYFNGGGMLVNFVFQFEWLRSWPDIWSNINLGVSMRMLLDEINI